MLIRDISESDGIYRQKYSNQNPKIFVAKEGILTVGFIVRSYYNKSHITLCLQGPKNCPTFRICLKCGQMTSQALFHNEPIKKECRRCWHFKRNIILPGEKYNLYSL